MPLKSCNEVETNARVQPQTMNDIVESCPLTKLADDGPSTTTFTLLIRDVTMKALVEQDCLLI